MNELTPAATIPRLSGMLRRATVLAAWALVAASAGLVPNHDGELRAPAAAAQGPQGTMQVVGQFGGDVLAVAVEGKRAYVGVGPRLAVYDVSDPAAPVRLGISAPLPGVVVDVVAAGELAFAIAGGLAVVDVSTPSAPRMRGHLPLGEVDTTYGWSGPSSLGTYSGYVYLAGNVSYQLGRLTVVDVRDPDAPRLVTRLESTYTATAVGVDGDRLYLGLRACFGPDCGPGHVALLVYDLADPASPKVTGDFAADEGARTVAGRGRWVALGESTCRLTILDVSDPGDPRQVNCLPLQSGGTVVDVAVNGDTVFALHASGTLTIAQLGPRGQLAGGGSVLAAPEGDTVAVDGARAFVGAGPYGLQVVDVSQPASPRRIGEDRPPGAFVDAVVDGAYAYVAGYASGLHVLDVSDPANVRQVGALTLDGGATDVVKVGNHLFLGVWRTTGGGGASTRLLGVDVTDPRAPRQVWQRDYANLTDLDTDGRHVVVLQADAATVLDVSESVASPRQVGSASLPRGTQAAAVAASGERAYVAVGSRGGGPGSGGGLRVDLFVLDTPRAAWLGQGAVGNAQSTAMAVAAQNSLAVVGTRGDFEVTVLDAVRPESPSAVGLWTAGTTIVPTGAAMYGRWLFLGTWAGVRAFDLAVPGYPQQVATMDTPEIGTSTALSVVVGGEGRLYLPRDDAGLLLADVELPTRPLPTAGPSPTRTSTLPPYPTLTPDPNATTPFVPGPTRRPTRTPSATLRPGETPATPTPMRTRPSGTRTPIGPGPGPGPSRTPTRTPTGTLTPPTATVVTTPGGIGSATPTRTPTRSGPVISATPTHTGPPISPTPTPTGTRPTATRTPGPGTPSDTPVAPPTSPTPPGTGTAQVTPPGTGTAQVTPPGTGTAPASPTSTAGGRIFLPLVVRRQ